MFYNKMCIDTELLYENGTHCVLVLLAVFAGQWNCIYLRQKVSNEFFIYKFTQATLKPSRYGNNIW